MWIEDHATGTSVIGVISDKGGSRPRWEEPPGGRGSKG